MTTCTKCGESVPRDAAFCENCGNAVKAVHGLSVEAAEMASADGSVGSGTTDVDLSVIGEVVASASHRGRRHTDNQDAVGIRQLRHGVALAVADGVSTSSRARAAADTAVRVAIDVLDAREEIDDDSMCEAVRLANEAVRALEYTPVPSLAEPQATLVLAIVQGNRVRYAWVGDSRLYLVSGSDTRAITEDDSWLNDSIKKGMPYSDAIKHPDAHCITQCLGMRDGDPVIHVSSMMIEAGSWLALCSDGLWNYLESVDTLHDLMRLQDSADQPVQKAERLVEFANGRGGHDNITVALYRSV